MKTTYEYRILPKSIASLNGISTVFYLQVVKKLRGIIRIWKTDVSGEQKNINSLKESVRELKSAKANIEIKNALSKVQRDVKKIEMWYNF